MIKGCYIKYLFYKAAYFIILKMFKFF